VLHSYQTGARKSPEMAAMSHVLSDDDVKNLAAYYARQKPRAVVFVPLQSK
jgi:cytochrome c553